VLHYWQGLTIDECAGELGVPSGTAKSRLNRALTRLRADVGRDEQ
jgi:DNA-directed RNA polymerase specialized sigma24 family protein